MNRQNAKNIAETITNEQLKQMFDKAKANITNWHVISGVNKGMTKGHAWNILASNFDVNKKYHPLTVVNMIWEFGDYLPDELKPPNKTKHVQTGKYIHHTDPKF